MSIFDKIFKALRKIFKKEYRIRGYGASKYIIEERVRYVTDWEDASDWVIDKLKEFSDWLGLTSFEAEEAAKKQKNQLKKLKKRYHRDMIEKLPIS